LQKVTGYTLSMPPLRLSAAALCAALLLALPARAADPFEIQVYDATANEPGKVGLEVHTNFVARGLTTAEGPEHPQNHQLHLTFEPSYGLTEWLELGGYLQFALRDGTEADFAGFKLRAKLVTPHSFSEHFRLGLNFEYSHLPETYDRARNGGELRPIVAWENDRFLFAANPIVGLTFDGSGLSFEPAAKAVLKLGHIGVGLEYYTSLGSVTGFDAFRNQEHALFQTLDILDFEPLELNLGIGEGLTRGSNDLVVKVIFGWSFGGGESPKK
jgi:hypothetical protein